MHDEPTVERTAGDAPLPTAASVLPDPERYRVIERLGAGGMGEVWRVYDRRLERALAMKLIHADLARNAAARARFRDEVRVTARLTHPSIVLVFDAGEDTAGRAWYTMQDVEQGTSLREVLARGHSADETLGERIRVLCAVAEAVAYAHARGVLHRDLKPGNILTGAFDQVLVLDWGLARDLVEGPTELEHQARSRPGTAAGRILGSPPYCPPEQALGRPEAHGPASDVYALGAILHEVLVGEPPFGGREAQMLSAFTARRGAEPLRGRVAEGAQPLAELADTALRFDPADRVLDAAAFAERLRHWREHSRRRAAARAAVARADALAPALSARREEARALRAAIEAHVAPPHAPEAQKWPAWALEDAAVAVERAVTDLEIREEQSLRAALDHAPELPEAHERLAEHYRGRLERAEGAGDAEAAARWEALVRVHDRGQHARWLSGDGALTLHTAPGAHATLLRVVEHRRRRVLEEALMLGVTPIVARPLARGSWVVRLTAPGRATVDYPVALDRCEHWDGAPPAGDAALPVYLPTLEELGPDDCYVPGGWCRVGGDPEATDPLPPGRKWVDGFVIRRHPVTVGEYAGFLEHVAKVSMEAALRLAPTQTAGAVFHRPLLAPGPDGHFVPTPDPDGVVWGLRWPVTLIDWDACVAFAAWEAARTGLPWRLVHELEWEKAARGVDGRRLPWGDHFEPTWANTPVSRPHTASRADVDAFPLDVSIYGVCGLVGNARDRCLNTYRRLGDPSPRLTVPPADPDDRGLRVSRGGAWLSSLPLCRPAGRFADPPERRMSAVGFRLARSLG